MVLQRYATDRHFPNPCFYIGGGRSGANFQRPGFQQMVADMENGEIGIIITKDLSRLGRNQLHASLYIGERFPMFGVRYIAINDSVDTDSSESNELMPFKNLFNEWYVRDFSRKVRAVLKAKAERGERLGTRAPYGCKKDEADSKKLVVNGEAAAIVRRIFAMCAAGSGPSPIARKLSEEQPLCPTTYAYQKFGVGHVSLNLEKPCHWTDSTIANMLENELYLGNTVNMRFSSKSYKDKRKVEHPREECLVFEGTHPALVTREVWDIVQQVRQNRRCPTKMNEQNKNSGLVVCADRGTTMVLHRAHTMKSTWNNFTCRTYKKRGLRFAPPTAKKLYEDRVLGHLSVEQFQTLSGSYAEEQKKLAEEIPASEAAIQKLRDTVSNTDGFLTKAKRYADITERTPELLRLFIQKIVVHEKGTKWLKKAA